MLNECKGYDVEKLLRRLSQPLSQTVGTVSVQRLIIVRPSEPPLVSVGKHVHV